MNVSQCYVLLLSILRNYKDLGTDPLRIFQLIEKFTFNYSAICKQPANKVEKLYSTYARKIEKIVKTQTPKKIPGKIQSIFAELEKDLKNERPQYEMFKDRFMEVSYGSSQRGRDLVKYTLYEINSIGQTGEHRIDFDNVNIEHVLPQKPSKKWNLTLKEIKSYVNLLGNLTLVSKKFNSQVGNKMIQEKISSYEDSEIEMTKALVGLLKDKMYEWDKDKILDRHKNFAEIAYNQVWNF